jgi:hypothetical protein
MVPDAQRKNMVIWWCHGTGPLSSGSFLVMASDSMPSFASNVASKARSLPRKLVLRLYDVSPTSPALETLAVFSPTLSDDIAGNRSVGLWDGEELHTVAPVCFYRPTHCQGRVIAFLATGDCRRCEFCELPTL